MDWLEQQLILARAPGLLATHLQAAAQTAGSASALIGADSRWLRELQLPPAAVQWLAHPDTTRVAADRSWAESAAVQVLSCLGPDYPPLLGEIGDAPAILFVRGDPGCLLAAQVAVVGSRNATATGRRLAREFAAALAQAGLVITSGLAVGIDAAAHAGALEAGGRSVAVLGCGLDRIYPPEHEPLARRLMAQGAVVSEFPPGVAPLAEHFPRRNRIISGLTLGTLVVEAASRSGSLITARLAGEQGREVFAIPGTPGNALARGCHELIRQGARLVESAGEVLAELKIPQLKQYLDDNLRAPPQAAKEGRQLDKDCKILLDALEFEPTSMDVLVARTGFPSPSVASMLLILELDGRVAAQPGGRYLRTA
ncbi:MAG: DNA-processing protein DprA [Steroidobacteraceae bacterium]